MSNKLLKEQAASRALQLVQAHVQDPLVIGVGTGSTVNCFIECLIQSELKVIGAVSSSDATTKLLHAGGIPVVDANDVIELEFYVDGADEVDPSMALIKGGGGALTGEKIVASLAKNFICIVDQTKIVDQLGRFPLPVEIIPMARNYVVTQLKGLGGEPILRSEFVSDNGNEILDVHNLQINQPAELEATINNISGVVCNGIFASNRPQYVLVATSHGVVDLKDFDLVSN